MIPLKIETLLSGQVVEQNRVEYKEGWNPSDIIHTICAYANDFDNVNGGYIVIGVKAIDGIPVLPPTGIEKEKIDLIQQEIFQYCNQIEPRYIPNIEVINYPDEDTYLIYLKCSAGDTGPYRAPKDVYGKKGNHVDKTMFYWIRPSSLTNMAKTDEIGELFEKFNSIPFDDRVNRIAKKDVIRRGYLEDFLKDSNSKLVSEINERSLEDLLVSLEVANETDTGLELRNIAILMFADRPDKFIPNTVINLVRFTTAEREAGEFTEKTFIGPIWKQVRDALSYIESTVLEEKVVKIKNQAEAERYFNYPYNALEEVLVNAVFHKSYRNGEPVEIRIYVDCIEIINFPGPDKWISMDDFASGKARARKYRNRRIGEFFKEIELSEKQGTGIPTILSELKKNGSDMPVFESDIDRNYLSAMLKIRGNFGEALKVSDKMSDKVSDKQKEFYEALLEVLEKEIFVTTDIMSSYTGIPKSTVRRYLNRFCESKVIQAKGKNKGTRYFRL